jgi:hypothetical protein
MALPRSKDELSAALASMSPAERREVLELLELRERLIAEQPIDPRCPMADYLAEFGGPPPQSTVRQAVHHDGELPSIEAFIREFAPVAPPAPPKAEVKATIADTRDIALRVPTRRQPKLLDDVIERTQAEMRVVTQSDEDRLALYRRGPVDLSAPGGFPDE